ncbi:MAG: M28 family peptidase [Gammaproteobacteria bacterium]|nr:M28 family peptidase [Gammaproteobacteria bacterium]NIR98157.1 M28 family peptidase [Gammaproteobacteria bacterium]NIT62544.1 M28 family peptidase [Gammaproteobacteria bacterium]NIV20801.1 M28 family peptidase [Gammaproteobacteria bacterium]NIY31124.1 M28 family peptidase [Gammaproteobacteria bacterium]
MVASAAELAGHVHALAVSIGERNVFRPDALRAAESYIEARWREQGYAVEPQRYVTQGVSCANLEVTAGPLPPLDPLILVGAHYDSVLGSPGANDNASGLAVLLELSRMAAADGAGGLRFVAFTNEEPPFFFTREQGSRLYAGRARRRGDAITLMVALETMGYYRSEPGSQRYPPVFRWFYPERGDFIALVSNLRSLPRMRRLARAFRAHSDFPLEYAAAFAWIPGVAWSDHLSFWMNGYRALMITDTAFYRYPYYHTPEDTAEKLDYDRLAQVTDGLYRALRALTGVGAADR